MLAASQLSSDLEQRRAQIGMTKSAVSRLSGVSLPTVNRIFAGQEERASIPNLQAIAAVLGVEVRLGASSSVYPLVDPMTFREEHARQKAERLVAMVQANMALEGLAVERDVLARMERQTMHELLASPRRLWDD